MYDLMLVLSREQSAPIAEQIQRACRRKNLRLAIFATGNAAKLAADARFRNMFEQSDTAIVCAESFERSSSVSPSFIELGSQTDHSMLAGESKKIISL